MNLADEKTPLGGEASGRAFANAEQEKDPNLLYGPVEAQWVLNVLDDTLQKLNVCSYLTPNILRDKMIDAVDPELKVALKEHFAIEREYIDLSRTLEEAEKAESEGILDQRTEENKKLLSELDLCLADSTRTVCRLLTGETHNLIVYKRLKELTTKRSPSLLEYINTFNKLRQLVHTKLRTTAEEERATQEQTADLAQKQKDDDAKYEELLKKLGAEQKVHKESITLKDQKISRLEAQIAQLEEETTQRRFDLKLQSERQESDAKSVFDTTKTQLEARLKQVEEDLATKGRQHFEEENSLHKRVTYKGEDIAGIIQKFDEEMRAQREALDELEEQYNAEKMELLRLEKHFHELDEENARVENQMIEIRKKRDRDLLDQRKRNHAAVMVQALFKGFNDRQRKARARAAKKAKEEAAGAKKR